MNKDRNRNTLMDLFRIFAVLLVLSVHCKGYMTGTPKVVEFFLGWGAYGAALYFVISGFFSDQLNGGKESLKKYYASRCIRILPMYYISLLFTFIVSCFVLNKTPISLEWIYHVFFLGMFIPSKEFTWKNSVNYFWTMPAFMAWYIVSPFIIKRCRTKKDTLKILIVSIVLVPPLKSAMRHIACQQFINWNFFCLLYCFVFGYFTKQCIQEKSYRMGYAGVSLALFIGFLIGNRSGFLLFSAVFSELILLTHQLRINDCLVVAKSWIIKVITELSNSCYSIYLTHWFILQFFGDSMRLGTWLAVYPLFVVGAVLFGVLCYECVERPIGNRLKCIL